MTGWHRYGCACDNCQRIRDESLHDRLWMHEQMRRDLAAKPKPTLLPLMASPQPDTAERTRLAVQAIPFAIPTKRKGDQ